MENITTKKPTIITIFGGSGDLTWRKLIPALYNLYLDGWLNEKFSIICIGRTEMKDGEFIKKLHEGVDKFSRSGKTVAEKWTAFSKFIIYKTGDFTNKGTFTTIKKDVTAFEKEAAETVNKIYYMAVNPQFFEAIADGLRDAGLHEDCDHARVVIEKPFGTDLKSAKALNEKLLSIFQESQLFRIDHYLGKETVQNLLAFRFANALFEPLWNRNYIDNVQITVIEKIGVEDRGRYYDHSGALRDMVQNHVMQLLCLIAMEPPVSFDANEIRNKKADVLHAIREIKREDVHEFASRGQYAGGWQEGEKVKGYRQEKDVPKESNTETFAAIKFFVDNWRWSNVPFYVRSGKRMQQTISVITVQFKPVPHQSFPDEAIENWQPNRMIINIQPDMGIRIRFQAKKPGLKMLLSPVDMIFNYNDTYSSGIPEGYETLLLDVIEGDATLFMRADQVEAAWEVITPILEMWKDNPSVNFPNYNAGTNGPETAEALIAKDGNNWIILPFEKKNNE
ncbi:MAG: glucose-6-phosphate dehydrogenase [Ferruginibacter sp.]|nr:glucose-6-phosphate dehydrogenase [Ferruginibacter sp.]